MIRTVIRHELLGAWVSGRLGVILGCFALSIGLVAVSALSGQATVRHLVAPLGLLLALTAPLVAMHTRVVDSGTTELWTATGAPPLAIIAAQWLAVWLQLVLCVAMAAPVVLAMAWAGDPDMGAVAAAGVGVGACAGATAAVAVAASSVAGEAAVAALTAALIGVASWLAGLVPGLGALSLSTHLQAASRGVVEPADLAWFGAVVAVSIAVAWAVEDARR